MHCCSFPCGFRVAIVLALLYFSAVKAETRTYYIAVDEVEWDYAPSNKDLISGLYLNDTSVMYMPMAMTMKMNGTDMTMVMNMSHDHIPAFWTESSTNRLGKVYKKAVYREYEGLSFSYLKERDPQWKHLGILGPVIRAEVGDTIVVVFKNNAPFQNYSMHPHGVFYKKQFEGAPYMNTTQRVQKRHPGAQGGAGDIVKPGESYTYTWEVPERAGPGPNDPSSICWFYHSHVDEVADTNAGLVGPIIITRKGWADPFDKSPKDVKREYITFFTVFDESSSWYIMENMYKYWGADAMKKENIALINGTKESTFVASNMMHTINGYIYGNLPTPRMKMNEVIRWYVMSLGNEADVHGIHWHGNTLLYNGHRVDSIDLIPASSKTLDMIPDNVGLWLYHCHTNHHVHGGMTSLYEVQSCDNAASCSPTTSSSTPTSTQNQMTTEAPFDSTSGVNYATYMWLSVLSLAIGVASLALSITLLYRMKVGMAAQTNYRELQEVRT